MDVKVVFLIVVMYTNGVPVKTVMNVTKIIASGNGGNFVVGCGGWMDRLLEMGGKEGR